MRTNITIATIAIAAGLGLAVGGCDDEQGRPDAAADDDAGEPAGDDDDSSPAGDDDDDGPASNDDAGEPPAVDEPLTEDQTRRYLSRIAPVVAGRSLRFDENQLIAEQGEDAIDPMVRGWVEQPEFAEAIRYMVQEQLHASGEREGVDYELPGNLAAELARDDLPWSTLLTADYCVGGDGSHIECDTGAPYAAGVLATRAYLISNKGRYNLGRAKLMLETFACRIYPMEQEIQIPLDKPTLIPMFRAETADEQEVEEAEGGFGNGIGCYHCHNQFGAHAQLFVKFDADGNWRDEATGQQDPYGELGRSFDGLYASHMNDPFEAADERSQVFGEQVANLREAGEVMSDHELFPQCTVKNLVAHAFGLQAGFTNDVDDDLVVELAELATAETADPSIGHYVAEVFTNKQVIHAVIATLESE